MTRTLAALALLLLAPAAHAQDEALICPSSADRIVYAKTLDLDSTWHTTLGGGLSQPSLWQVGTLNQLPAAEVVWKPVHRYPVPYNRLASRELLAVDVWVQARSVTGGDVPADIYLLGAADPKRMTAAELHRQVALATNVESAYFYQDEAGAYPFWVDELVAPMQRAIAERQVYLSLALSPTAPAGAPTHTARISKSWLRIHHCPAPKPARAARAGISRYMGAVIR
jgi:hypothetical protein